MLPSLLSTSSGILIKEMLTDVFKEIQVTQFNDCIKKCPTKTLLRALFPVVPYLISIYSLLWSAAIQEALVISWQNKNTSSF